MKVLVLLTMLMSCMVMGQKLSKDIPFIGTRDFNFAGGGTCCNVSIKITKNGYCKITGGMYGTVLYSGKYKPVMNGHKIFKKNGSVYVAMLNNKGKIFNDCHDFEGNTIPCVFKLEKY